MTLLLSVLQRELVLLFTVVLLVNVGLLGRLVGADLQQVKSFVVR